MFEKEFEKEAEEYQIRKHHQRLYGHKPVVMKELNTTFKDGAEFGYNKANEWHNIKENPTDLPNDGKLVVADDGLAMECVKFRKNRISELEKKNTELKEKNKSYEELIDNGSTTLMKEKLKNYKQLSKAKEIIKNLLTLSIPIDYAKCPGPLQKIAEAEQFLKEVSE